MAEETTTIQVRRQTADRLNALKVPGLTYDDVIDLALDHLPPEEIKRLFAEWQAEALSKLSSSPSVRGAKPSSKAR